MLAVNRDLIISNPELLSEIKAEAKATLEMAKQCEELIRLRKLGEWGNFDWSVMVQWCNRIDEPFIKLMTSLAKHGYKYNPVSMHLWWRRLKALNQQHIITYFSYVGFQAPRAKRLFWSDLYAWCCRNCDMFKEMAEQYRDDRTVEMSLRAMLGISQDKDIKQAWSKWAKTNHPDKGGSVDTFVLVKAAYEEWEHAQCN